MTEINETHTPINLTEEVWSTVVKYFTQKPRENRPVINVEIEECETDALVDSGSQVSLLDSTLWNQMKTMNNMLHLSNVSSLLKAANGSPIKPLGGCVCTVKIGRSLYKLSFIIVEGLKCQCLIGADIMCEIGMQIDMKNKKISVEGPIILRNKRKIVMECYSEKIHSFEVSKTDLNGKNVIVTENCQQGLVTLNGVCSVIDNEVKVLMCNPTEQTIVVDQFDILMTVERENERNAVICNDIMAVPQ